MCFSVDVSHFDDVSSINDVQVWSLSLCGMNELANKMLVAKMEDDVMKIPMALSN